MSDPGPGLRRGQYIRKGSNRQAAHTGPVCYSRGQPGRSAKPQAAERWPPRVDLTESVSHPEQVGLFRLLANFPGAPAQAFRFERLSAPVQHLGELVHHGGVVGVFGRPGG